MTTEEIWRGKCGQWASGSAGGIWKLWHKTELGGDEWPDTLEERKHKLCHTALDLTVRPVCLSQKVVL